MSRMIDEELGSLELVANLVAKEIDVAIARHDGGGLEPLRRRVARIMAGGIKPRLLDLAQREMDLERRWWIAAVRDLLQAERLVVLAVALREGASREAQNDDAVDPWTPLDASACQLQATTTKERISRVSEDVIRACRSYEETRRNVSPPRRRIATRGDGEEGTRATKRFGAVRGELSRRG